MFRLWSMTMMVLALGCGASDSDVSPFLSSPVPAAPAAAVATGSIEDCPITDPFIATRPIPRNEWRDAFAAGGAWFMSTPKSTWTVGVLDDQLWFDAQPGYWTGDGRSQKALWLKPVGSTLEVTGRRLDGDGFLTSDVSGDYLGDFQASGLTFSSAGCWEVEARAGDARLHFIIWVNPPDS